ncbi:putative oxidoreductase [Albidovulum inexpectatum]|uniref:Putative oxidoreductase n=1 Tax=Albidovulum inexpectatum TaxID=196587 RepID=A0A2S5JJA2_9RHOB|nr:DoxX family protein [Albidovulum inexpectatum]PPB81471.1 putative oxidoreductase [Albidovulum inexpectatum]
MKDIGILVARILLAILFITAGMGKLGNVQGFAAFMESGGVPAFLAWPVIALEILGGVAVLIGLLTRPAALALGGFSVLAGLLYHFDPADQMQMTMLMKNLGLGGGFLLLALQGPGTWSVDAALARGRLQHG